MTFLSPPEVVQVRPPLSFYILNFIITRIHYELLVNLFFTSLENSETFSMGTYRFIVVNPKW